MLHAIFTFKSLDDYDRAYGLVNRVQRETSFYSRYADFHFYDKYRIMVMSYTDNCSGTAVLQCIANQLANGKIDVFHPIFDYVGFTVDHPFLKDDFTEKNWLYTELSREKASEFKRVLREYNIKFEPSECYNNIFFSIYCDDLERYLLWEYL